MPIKNFRKRTLEHDPRPDDTEEDEEERRLVLPLASLTGVPLVRSRDFIDGADDGVLPASSDWSWRR